ncbi:TetM/TetW/TetO/TetS family tetracycline resistance ribosomal protection protein [Planotetraspora phitsanulokensis]|uniref:Tetracycline resistance protein, tetM/tetO subfamily n=1 Tax=Planotetraspora phitsanulokensis TaxID=575192 RepID=A0A8J3U3Q3_9ACTN|nr:TetM/TetW/TetO/TetS family tetracycline resistance ribosomal protection protein [Planotetraspora phitsanulokensis]GII36417.1 tetracycline resistance protein, tetM/tetO subfamily [Planotetraspora phitsanulokensis]
MRTLNLGILAHVDAGKTSLTERLLHAAGVIDEIGSVDDGNTQTDSLALERQRGITIKSAVVSFVIGDVTVNLIDTPGHPDFIAEVERVLNVLDGAVLVISAVEGVQAQTRVLMRTLRRLRIPTLIFVNKIDRGGARDAHVLRVIAETLTPSVVSMGSAYGLGTRDAGFTEYGPADGAFTTALADVLAGNDDAILAAYVGEAAPVPYGMLRAELVAQTGRALVHPVFFGSAITGAGVDALISGLTELLPAGEGDARGPVSGTVFKVERGPAGEKIAYVRMFSGTLRTRDRLRLRDDERKVTAIRVFDHGSAVPRGSVAAGQIGQLWGLADVRIGDAIGVPSTATLDHHFAPPTLETAVVPRRSGEKEALHTALAQLAEQDPLINLRQDDTRQELFLSLYGEVQKEVIQQTLAADYAVDVDFRETTMICVERPVGTGTSVEVVGRASNPFLATVGLRVDPAAPGSGVRFGLDVKLESVPLYVYKAVEEFRTALEKTVRDTLRQGLHGWQVVDCAVTLTQSGYVSPETTARDFRLLTPLVLMSALKQAGTVVCEPIHRFHLEVPADTVGAIAPALARSRAVPRVTETRGPMCTLDGDIPAGRVHDLHRRLRGLTHGEGVMESVFDHYAPVRGPAPVRRRTDNNPLSREEYLLHIRRRV